jgi:hypothetical protein
MDTPVMPAYQNLSAETGWKNAPTINDLVADIDAARPAQNEYVTNLRMWKDYHNAKGVGAPPKRKGRSQVQPKLIKKNAEWRHPSMSEPFLSSSKLFQARPRTWEDVAPARQAELLLNFQADTYIDKVCFIDDYVRVGDNEGTVIIEVGWHRVTKKVPTEVPTIDFFAITEPAQMAQLQADMQLASENPREFSKLPIERQEAAKLTANQGVPVFGVVTKVEIKMVEKVVKNCPTAKIMDNENMFIDPSCNGVISDARFIGYSFETSKGELRADGRYTNIDHIVTPAAATAAEAQHHSTTPNEFQFKDEERKRFVAYKQYFLWDTEGDGVLRPVVATWAGNILLQLQYSPFTDEEFPFIVVAVNPEPGEWWGEPDGALLIENQKTIGALTRGMIDLLGRSANGQQGMPKQFLDAPNRKKFEDGEDYEYTPAMGNPEQLIILHKYPEIPQSALVLNQMQNQEAESLTGQNTWGNGINAGSLGDVAAGVKGALAASAKREMSILRRYANGISKLGQKWLNLSKDLMSDEEIVRITNDNFVTITRDGIEGKMDIIVDVSSAEEDNLKAQELSFMLQTIGPNADWGITSKVMSEIARLRKMPELAHDIANYKPQPSPVEVAREKAEIRKLEAEAAEAEAKVKTEQARALLYVAQARAAGSKADLQDLQFIEQESGTTHVRDMAQIEAQGEANQDLTITKALVEQGDLNAAIGFTQLTKSR